MNITPSDTNVPQNFGSLHTADPCPATSKSILITHKFQQDNLPRYGQLIKIRLDNPLPGPGSSHLSATTPTGATKQNYYCSCSLLPYAHLRCLILSVLIPAYTGVPSLGVHFKSWVTQLPVEMRRENIPMPC